MKKVFKFALVAVMVLPLMFACKPHEPEEPTDPADQPGTEEWFDKWTEGDKEDKVSIKEENLYGLWKMEILTIKDADSVAPINAYDFSNDENNAYFLELNKDKTYTYYARDNSIMYKDEGSWGIVDYDHIRFSKTSTGQAFWSPVGDYIINWLEENRLVIKHQYEGALFEYQVFIRVDELPKFPQTTTEKLVANSWKIIADTVMKFSYQEGMVELYDEDLLPVNSTITFDNSGIVTVKDKSGTLIGQTKWQVRQDMGSIAMIDILTSEGRTAEDENIDIIPGLHNVFDFNPEPNYYDKPVFEHLVSLDDPDPKKSYFKVWRYYLEPVK